MTLEQYILAINNLAKGALTVQLKLSDGSLTLPMTISAAAEYLYNGNKPLTKTMPSEQIAEKQDKAWSANVAQKAEEKLKARESDQSMRNFYTHGMLPALTFGTSELFTNGDPRTMSLAQASGIGLRAAGRSWLPIALGTGLWSWYASTHEPPSFSSSYSGSYMADAAPTDSAGTTPANPAPTDSAGTANPSVAPTTGTATGASPEPERNDSTSLRRPSFRERLGDRIAGRNRQTTSSGNATPPNNDNQNGSFLGRMLWETKNNNFGLNWWQWRNVGRVGLGLSYPAREHIWPAVGKTAKYMVAGPDSIPPSTTPPQATPGPQTAAPADTVPGQAQPDSTSYNSFDAELEELRKAYGGN